MSDEDALTLMDVCEEAGIPYLAWTFHMRCAPNLIRDNSGGDCGVGMAIEPTEWGELFRDRLARPVH